jgi:ABC-type transport system involved in Fe-S cluster assembly, permease and ATPase components
LSAVDAKTEEAILEALKQNRQNKTTIIVAHRLSSIKHAQLILVLENGHIVERGNHLTLIKNKGWYADIFRKQETYKGGEEHG